MSDCEWSGRYMLLNLKRSVARNGRSTLIFGGKGGEGAGGRARREGGFDRILGHYLSTRNKVREEKEIRLYKSPAAVVSSPPSQANLVRPIHKQTKQRWQTRPSTTHRMRSHRSVPPRSASALSLVWLTLLRSCSAAQQGGRPRAFGTLPSHLLPW